jgi:hypothetical protein
MKRNTICIIAALAALLAVGLASRAWAQQQPSVAERVASLKASVALSHAVLKKYEWVETTVISLKGEEKSRQLNRCYYGADGGVMKVPLTTPSPEKKKRGLRGRIAENKKEELTEYMQQAVGLVKSYVPPDPNRIQAAKDAGKVSVDILQKNKRIRLTFRDYAKPGDTLAVEIDTANNRLLGLKVSSYVENAEDTVTLGVKFAKLADGTGYAKTITLDATKKKVKVQVDNAGYRKMPKE